MLEKQRSLIIFEESIKSENTKHVYHYLLEKFKRWAKVESFDDLLKADKKSIQRLVEDYVIHLKNKVSPNSFSSQCNAVYRPLIFFKDGYRCEPPPTVVLIADDPYGWQYLEEFNRANIEK